MAELRVLVASGELTLRVVGPFAVCRAHRVLPPAEVGSRKARTVLAVLAVRTGFVPVDRIVGAVWGDAPPRDPVANVATLVSRLRARLGSSTIAGNSTGYYLGDQVRVDLFEAAELVAEADAWIAGRQPAQALWAARRAVHLLDNGEVLAERAEASWVEPARAWHGKLLRQARHAIAEAALRVGDIHAAQIAAEAAITTDAFDEAACRMLMIAHHTAGEPARALQSYRRLCTTLAIELGIDPAPRTRDLHVAILRSAADRN